MGDPVAPCPNTPVTLQVRLCNQNQDPIPHAPCTLTQGATKIAAEADDDGIVTVQVSRQPNLLIVEWSDPEEGTGEGESAYSLDIYIFPGDDDEGLKQRLHNVGYSEEDTLEAKVRSFQRDFGRPETGSLSAEEQAEVIRWHDGGDKPSVAGG